MLPDVTDTGFQVQLAEYFKDLRDKEGREAFEVAASRTIAGLSTMIYQTSGPEALQVILNAIPTAIESGLLKHLKPFNYQVIPASSAEPIRRGMLMLLEPPAVEELGKIVLPLLGCRAFGHILVHVDGEPRDLFCDEMTGIREMPLNERTTELYRAGFLSVHPDGDPESVATISGPAVLFEERVWF
jgi:hypothetical protein